MLIYQNSFYLFWLIQSCIIYKSIAKSFVNITLDHNPTFASPNYSYFAFYIQGIMFNSIITGASVMFSLHILHRLAT